MKRGMLLVLFLLLSSSTIIFALQYSGQQNQVSAAQIADVAVETGEVEESEENEIGREALEAAFLLHAVMTDAKASAASLQANVEKAEELLSVEITAETSADTLKAHLSEADLILPQIHEAVVSTDESAGVLGVETIKADQALKDILEYIDGTAVLEEPNILEAEIADAELYITKVEAAVLDAEKKLPEIENELTSLKRELEVSLVVAAYGGFKGEYAIQRETITDEELFEAAEERQVLVFGVLVNPLDYGTIEGQDCARLIEDNGEKLILSDAKGYLIGMKREVFFERFNATGRRAVSISSMKLDVPIIPQRPELVYGCEITSFTMLALYSGAQVDKMVLAEEMPRHRSNPNLGFVGNPDNTYGRINVIYPPALMELAEKHAGNAVNLTGGGKDALMKQFSLGAPVLVWMSGMHNFGEHTVVVSGYDQEGIFYNDPWTGEKDCKMTYDVFMKRWGKQSQRALSYKPESEG